LRSTVLMSDTVGYIAASPPSARQMRSHLASCRSVSRSGRGGSGEARKRPRTRALISSPQTSAPASVPSARAKSSRRHAADRAHHVREGGCWDMPIRPTGDGGPRRSGPLRPEQYDAELVSTRGARRGSSPQGIAHGRDDVHIPQIPRTVRIRRAVAKSWRTVREIETGRQARIRCRSRSRILPSSLDGSAEEQLSSSSSRARITSLSQQCGNSSVWHLIRIPAQPHAPFKSQSATAAAVHGASPRRPGLVERRHR